MSKLEGVLKLKSTTTGQLLSLFFDRSIDFLHKPKIVEGVRKVQSSVPTVGSHDDGFQTAITGCSGFVIVVVV